MIQTLIRQRLQKIFIEILEDQYNYDNCESELQRLLEKSTTLNLEIHQYEALRNLGILHAISGELKLALSYFNDGYAIALKLENISGIFNSLNNLANVYDRLGEVEEATRLSREALTIAQKHPELKPRIILVATNLGNTLCYQGHYMEAEEIFKYCLEIYNELSPIQRRNDVASRHLIAIYSGLMMIYIERKRYRIAREYLTLAIGMFQDTSIFGRLLIVHLISCRLAYFDPESPHEFEDKLRVIDDITLNKKTSLGEAAYQLLKETVYWKNHNNPKLATLFAEKAANFYTRIGDHHNLQRLKDILNLLE